MEKKKVNNGHLEIQMQRRSCWIIVFIEREPSNRSSGPFSRERVERNMDAFPVLVPLLLTIRRLCSDMASHSAAVATATECNKRLKEMDGRERDLHSSSEVSTLLATVSSDDGGREEICAGRGESAGKRRADADEDDSTVRRAATKRWATSLRIMVVDSLTAGP
jgi:hypothetical protein